LQSFLQICYCFIFISLGFPALNRFKKYLFFFILLFPFLVKAQEQSNFRLRQLKATGDTIQLDTLSIVPGSFKLTDQNGNEVDTSSYSIDAAKGILILHKNRINSDSLTAVYRTFPFSFTKPLQHKNPTHILPGQAGVLNPFRITYKDDKAADIFQSETFSNRKD
jgi:hypothetical protein